MNVTTLSNEPLPTGSVGEFPLANRLPRVLRDFFASLLGICRSRMGIVAALALNAIWMPYVGFEHDGALYALQSTQRAFPGVFANDLFLKFGTQDQLTVFSSMMAPLVRLFGTETAFFFVYLTMRFAFFAAVFSLFRAIFKNRAIVGLALMFVAVVPIRYGGLGTFLVNEPFLTARTFAHTLSIFALACMIRGQLVHAATLTVASLLMHPIITLPIFLTLIFCVGHKLLRPKLLIITMGVCSILFLLSLLIPSMGHSSFGYMDSAWRDVIRDGMPYLFPELWSLPDWERLLFVFMLALAASVWAKDRDFPVIAGLLIAAMAGMGLSILAPHLPYALTLQAQTYRCVWPLYLLAIPMGMEIVRLGWRRDEFWLKLGALGLFMHLLFAGDVIWRPLALVVFLMLTITRFIRGSIHRWHTGVLLFVLLVISAVYNACQTSSLIAQMAESDMFLRGANIWRRDLAVGLGSALCLLLSWMIIQAVVKVIHSKRVERFVWLGCFLGFNLIAVALVKAPWCGAYGPDRFADVKFVKQTIAANPNAKAVVTGKLPTVHWPTRNPWETWFDINACSYFSINQIGVGLFDRESAMEIVRRAKLAAHFDVPYLSSAMPVAIRKSRLESVYDWKSHSQPEHAISDVAALFQLGADPELDYIVLPQEVGDWAMATNGRWFVYDCHAIREILIADMERLKAQPMSSRGREKY